MLTEEQIIEATKKANGAKEVKVIDINDTFNFKCKRCGQCCMHRHDIILNPFDVYNGAKYLNITPEEFMDKYLDIQLGAESKLPMLLLKSDKKTGFCPFLKFDIKAGGKFGCSINPAKPGACANHPIGVVIQQSDDDNDSEEEEFIFIKVDQCENSKSNDKVLVKDWVKNYTDNAKEIKLAHELQTYITKFISPVKLFNLSHFIATNKSTEELPDRLKEIIKSIFVGAVGNAYLNYDINKPFLEQAEQNKDILKDFFEQAREVFDKLDDLFRENGFESMSDALERLEQLSYNDDTEHSETEGGNTNGNN